MPAVALDRTVLAVNLGVAFFLELGALAALALLGSRIGGGGAASVVLAVAFPLAAAVLWGMFAAPKSAFDVPALAIVVKVLVLGGAAVALAVVSSEPLGAAFAAAVVINLGLIALLD
jgi:hypothetical protein